MNYLPNSGSWCWFGLFGALSVLSACSASLDGDSSNAGTSTGAGIPVGGSTDVGAALGLGELGLVRLTQSQYRNVLIDSLGLDPNFPLNLEEDHFDAGFASVGARAVAVSRTGVSKYESAAISVAAALATEERYSSFSGCPATEGTPACFEGAIRKLQRALFRRTPTPEEVASYVGVATSAHAQTSDVLLSFETALTGILLSPHFLYQHEATTLGPDGTTPILTDVALANRLSLLIWDSGPDEPLLTAAENGTLSTLEGLTAEVDRMLSVKEKWKRGVQAFADGYLSLFRLTESPKDAEVFPDHTPEIQEAMTTAALRSVTDVVVDRDADFKTLLTQSKSFLSGPLSNYLGEPVTSSPEFVSWDWGASSRRGGLLTEPAIMSLTARSEKTSPTLRGIFINGLLCREVDPPPAGVDTSIPEPSAPTTRRDEFEQHVASPVCAGCHKLMDPMGFALEYFDAVGRSRESDGGFPINGTGTLNDVPFNGPRELSKVVASDPAFEQCLTTKWLIHALGRDIEHGAHSELQAYRDILAGNGGRVGPLVRAIALSSAFRKGALVSP